MIHLWLSFQYQITIRIVKAQCPSCSQSDFEFVDELFRFADAFFENVGKMTCLKNDILVVVK